MDLSGGFGCEDFIFAAFPGLRPREIKRGIYSPATLGRDERLRLGGNFYGDRRPEPYPRLFSPPRHFLARPFKSRRVVERF